MGVPAAYDTALHFCKQKAAEYPMMSETAQNFLHRSQFGAAKNRFFVSEPYSHWHSFSFVSGQSGGNRVKLRSDTTRRRAALRRSAPPNGSTLISTSVFTLHAVPRGATRKITICCHFSRDAARLPHISGILCLFSEFVVQYMTVVLQMTLQSCKNATKCGCYAVLTLKQDCDIHRGQ